MRIVKIEEFEKEYEIVFDRFAVKKEDKSGKLFKFEKLECGDIALYTQKELEVLEDKLKNGINDFINRCIKKEDK